MDRFNLHAKNIMKKINKKNFKKTLGYFTTGVTIIAVKTEKKNIGKTVNSFSSLSLTPPLILFSLDKKSSSLKLFQKSKFVSINILSKHQKKLSINFAKKNAKWKNIKYDISPNKTPLINNCLANLECKVVKLIPQGDHIIFLCEVLYSANRDDLEPLIYFDSAYI